MRIEGGKRAAAALAILLSTGALAWATMDAGKVRDVVMVVLGGFALRIALFAARRQKG